MPSPSKNERNRKRYCQKYNRDFESDREKLIQTMKAKYKADKSKLLDEIANLKITNTTVTEQRDLLANQLTSIQLGLALELFYLGSPLLAHLGHNWIILIDMDEKMENPVHFFGGGVFSLSQV